MKLILLIAFSIYFLNIQSLQAKQEGYMDYEDFLFDVKDYVGKDVKVQVYLLDLNLPDRIANVDEHVDIDMELIKKEEILDVSKLCDFDTTCWLDVEGKVVKNPNIFPAYILRAEKIKLYFLIGVAVSETGYAYINTSEEGAVEYLREDTNEEYLSGYVWADGSGTLAVGHGLGPSEFFAAWSFHKDKTTAIVEALNNCNDEISGVLNIGVECGEITFDIPWW